MNMNYQEFLESKSNVGIMHGFDPIWIPEFLYDFQKDLVDWSIRKGRAAIFADCGLGKTPMQLVWAENIARKTNGNVLILTPLAVSAQTLNEAEKFGIDISRSRGGSVKKNITITNYEKLDHFDSKDFQGVVCDESSILKNFNGVRRQAITEFMKKMPYRLLCTATAAPNDYIELGTSSEALGAMGFMDMLNRFFKNNQNNCALKTKYRRFGDHMPQWRFKKHAEIPFWRWISSWGRAIRKPSDMGYNDGDFILPELIENETVIKYSRPFDGKLFVEPAYTLAEQREERRSTITERCEKVAEIVFFTWQKECFCDKLANKKEGLPCGKKNMPTIEERNIKSLKVKEPKEEGKEGNQKKIKSICENTTRPIGTGGTKEHLRSERNTTKIDAIGMLPMKITESKSVEVHRNIIEKIQKNDSLKDSNNMELPLMSITESLKSKVVNAPYADQQIPEINEQKGSTLTIATKQVKSEDYYVPAATWGSENLKKAQIYFSEHQSTYRLSSYVIWCHLNDEQSFLEKMFGDLAFSVHGSLSDDVKEERLLGFVNGERPILITKSKIAGFGLNFQFCHNVIIFPSHSYEQYYQAVRRCWRFGQKNPVIVDIITTEGEFKVLKNLKRKAKAADKMFTELTFHMRNALDIKQEEYKIKKVEVPIWM